MQGSPDLSKRAGFPLRLDPVSGRLRFGNDILVESPRSHRRSEMLAVLAEPGGDGPEELYFMWRNAGGPGHRAMAERHGLRYDLTALRPGTVGREFIKTAGHYHPVKPGTATAYPEVYEVLHGRAVYLLQNLAGDGSGPGEAVLIEAKPGDKVIIPPGYGHITINVSADWLVMGNWTERSFASLYEPVRAARGGAVYLFADQRGFPFSVLNPSTPPGIRLYRLQAGEVRPLEIPVDRPMYASFMDSPSAFAFLTEPERYGPAFLGLQEAWQAVQQPISV